MKKIFLKLIILSSFIVALFLFNFAMNKDIAVFTVDPIEIHEIEKSETYPASRGSLAKVHTSIMSIIDNTDEIIFCEVIKARNVEYAEFPMTISSVKVTRSIKGQVSIGSIINVAEMGGELTGKGKFVLDVPVMTVGNNYCLFVFKDNDLYRIVGAFQGKFVIKSGYIFQQATIDTKLKDYEPLSENYFVDYINKTMIQMAKAK